MSPLKLALIGGLAALFAYLAIAVAPLGQAAGNPTRECRRRMVKNNFTRFAKDVGPILTANQIQWQNAGENHNRDGTSATDVASQWEQVPGTNTNMLQSAGTQVGVARCTKGSAARPYWVAVFIQP